MASGTESAWATLENLPAEEVCRNADVRFDSSRQAYVLKCFGQDLAISSARREIKGDNPVAGLLLGKLKDLATLAILRYLVDAREIPLSGKLIRPSDLKAGRIFTTGSHVLPLDKLAQQYGDDLPGFLERGQELGGVPAGLGDASLRLLPFPRVPAVMVLWRSCAEFEARADLLLDATCELQMKPDIVWATALLSILLMMVPEQNFEKKNVQK